MSDQPINQEPDRSDSLRMLKTAAKIKVRIPAIAQLFQTNGLCSGTEYSPLNIRR